MENSIDPPGKVTENAVNTAAAAAIDTTLPAPTNDKTSPSKDDDSACVLVQKKRCTEADLSVSKTKQGTQTNELQGDTTQRKPTRSWPLPLPLYDNNHHHTCLSTTTKLSYTHWEAYAWTNGLALH
ncbi:hypothetical protein MRX96_001820 [Rhipicephalus microplus]